MWDAALIARDLGLAWWKVATTGMSAHQTASRPRLGDAGSWTCSTSNLPSDNHRRTRDADSGPKVSRATEPL